MQLFLMHCEPVEFEVLTIISTRGITVLNSTEYRLGRRESKDISASSTILIYVVGRHKAKAIVISPAIRINLIIKGGEVILYGNNSLESMESSVLFRG